MAIAHKRIDLLRFVSQLWFDDPQLLSFSVLTIVLSSLVHLSIPFGGKQLIDSTGTEIDELQKNCLVLSVSILGYHFISLASHLACYRMSLQVTTKMLRLGLVAICDANWSDIVRNNPVELGRMIAEASKYSGDTLATLVTELLSSIISAIGTLFLVFYISARLTLLFAVVVGCTQLFSHWYSRRFHVSGADFARRDANLQAVIVNSIQRSSAIRIFGCRSTVLRNFDVSAAKMIESGRDLNFGIHFHACVSSGVTNVLFILLIAIASYYKARGEFDIADLAMFFFYMKSLLDRVLLIAQEIRKLGVMLDKADTFCTFERNSHSVAGRSHIESSVLRLTGVSYRYSKNGTNVLDNVNLELPIGKLVALSGPSGSGKSTILKLFARLIDPSDGVVETLGRVAMLEQSHSIFIGTIEENIRIGNPLASDYSVRSAADRAGCRDFIESLPLSFKTVIENPDQAQFSGGQLQRICLARVFLSDASLIILDEPTTGLDEQAANIVIQSASCLRDEGRTVLFASHDPRALQTADVILAVPRFTRKSLD